MKKKFLSKFMVSGVFKGVGMACSLALSVVLARTLGLTDFGAYSFLISFAMLASILTQFGLPQLVVRETARLKEHFGSQKVRELWNWATILTIGLSCLVGLLVTAWVLIVENDNEYSGYFVVAFFLAPLYALGNLRAAALRGIGKLLLGQLPDIILRPLIFLILLGIFAVFGPSIDVLTALGLHVTAAIGAFFVGATLLFVHAPKGVNTYPSPLRQRIMFGSVFFLGLSSSLIMINTHMGTFMLGLLNQPAEAGQLRVALTLSMLVSTGLTVSNTLLQPQVSALHARGDLAGLQALVTQSSRITFVSSATAVLGLYLFGNDILRIAFGTEFLSAGSAFFILVLGQLVLAAFGPIGLLLNMSGHERTTFRGVLISVIVSLTLSVVLIPLFAAVGAAVAAVTGSFTYNVLLYFKVRSCVGVDSTPLGNHPNRE